MSSDLNASERAELERLREEVAALRAQQAMNDKTPSSSSSPPPPPAASAVASSLAGAFLSSPVGLDKQQVERYSRQALLTEVGPEGCAAFFAAKVAVIGCGGLGSTAILYLVASGVGHVVLVDADVVDRSNLHRQIIHTDAHTGMPKVASAKQAALALNPTVRIDTFCERFSPANADTILDKVDVVLDCTDNVSARYLINDACVRRGLPLVSGAAMRWDGQLSVYNVPLGATTAPAIVSQRSTNATKTAATSGAPSVCSGNSLSDNHRAPTYRCMHPQPPPQAAMGGGCNDIGVFGPVPGIIGCLQALEALKAILFLSKLKQSRCDDSGAGNMQQPTSDHLMAGRMLVWDGHAGTFRCIKMRPRSAAGVEQSTSGELAALGGAYDGCGMAKIAEDGVTVTHVKAADVRASLQDSKNRRRRDREHDNNNEGDVGAGNDFVSQLEESKRMMRHFLAAGEASKKRLAVTLIVDVRVDIQFRLCNLSDLYALPSHDGEQTLLLHFSLPYKRFETAMMARAQQIKFLREELFDVFHAGFRSADVASLRILLLCRRGRDSTRAAIALEKMKRELSSVAQVPDAEEQLAVDMMRIASVQNIVGGLNAWSEHADSRFPYY